MAYRLNVSQPLTKGVRRIAREQIERARTALADRDAEAKGVHEARKAIKRLRALLRLVRTGLGERVWRRENEALRDAARCLAAKRDRAVLGRTIGLLRQRLDGEKSAAIDGLEEHVTSERPAKSKTGGKVLQTPQTLASAQLADIGHRLEHVSLTGSDDDILEAGLAATMRAGRRTLERMHAAPDDDHLFHELRKSTQRYWRQMQILSSAWPAATQGRIAVARHLSDLIGEDHDLAVLAERTRAAGRSMKPADVRDIIGYVAAAQKEIRVLAIPDAERLFAQKPRWFAAEMVALWRLSRRLGEAKRGDGVPVAGEGGENGARAPGADAASVAPQASAGCTEGPRKKPQPRRRKASGAGRLDIVNKPS